MKKKNFITLLLFLCLIIVVILSLPCRRIFSHLKQRDKNAFIIIANDSDKTMEKVFSEFKDFSIHGYCQGKYPELEKLYSSKESWHWKNISEFNTSIRMQSFGVEKEISLGNWKNLLPFMDDCISGYRLFIPFNQETSAITYLFSAIKTLKRLTLKNKAFPREIRKKAIVKLLTLRELVETAPPENTNNFKKEFLLGIRDIISNLESTNDAD